MSSGDRLFSVPGNLLLMGEYAVLEEGGLGVALAVDRRARVSLRPAPSLHISGTWPGGAIAWTPEGPGASPLLNACVYVVEEWLREQEKRLTPPRAFISIDTSAFFAPDGRKSGFGSSAATTVAAVVALLTAAGIPVDQRLDLARDLAIAAHRRAQDGVGSGYDVTASLNGGMGLFRGGASPTWEACALAWGPVLLSFAGARAVITQRSVRRYEQWKARNPGPAREFLADSNAVIRAFIAASSGRAAAPWFERSRRIGLALGEAIGVPASLEPPAGLDPAWCKALGAGNERGICLAPSDAPGSTDDASWQRIVVAREGIRWEE
jgi:phosphomevalonate kinase